MWVHLLGKLQENSWRLSKKKTVKLNSRSLQLYEIFTTSRSSRPHVFCKKDVFRNFAKFTGKHFINFIKKETPAQVFSCEFREFLRALFLTEHLSRGCFCTPQLQGISLGLFRVAVYRGWLHKYNTFKNLFIYPVSLFSQLFAL